MRRALLLAALAAAACGDDERLLPDAAVPDGVVLPDASLPDARLPDAPAADAAPCVGESGSTLAGVSIAVAGPCVFTLAQAAAGIEIPYQVVAVAAVADVRPAAQDAGGCGQPGPTGLILFETVAGGGQQYCLCDTGLCAPAMPLTTVPAGSFPATFSWNGRNWTGPSDFGNPVGPPFPEGDYTFRVSATGTAGGAAFEVFATYPITLVP